MASLNSFDFTGRLGRDPELRSTANGTPVCNMSVAVDQYGDRPTLWVDVSVWGRAAETCARYLSKGREVAIAGQVDEVRAYMTKSGEPGASLRVSTRDVAFIGAPVDGQGGEQRPAARPAAAQPVAVPAAPVDDDIPF